MAIGTKTYRCGVCQKYTSFMWQRARCPVDATVQGELPTSWGGGGDRYRCHNGPTRDVVVERRRRHASGHDFRVPVCLGAILHEIMRRHGGQWLSTGRCYLFDDNVQKGASKLGEASLAKACSQLCNYLC